MVLSEGNLGFDGRYEHPNKKIASSNNRRLCIQRFPAEERRRKVPHIHRKTLLHLPGRRQNLARPPRLHRFAKGGRQHVVHVKHVRHPAAGRLVGHVAEVLPFDGVFRCGDNTFAVFVESGAAQELEGHLRRRFRALSGASGTADSGLQRDVCAEFSEEYSRQPIGKNQVSLSLYFFFAL